MGVDTFSSDRLNAENGVLIVLICDGVESV
jgi:hypothetical protein